MSENENLDNVQNVENKRPTFLTVLCILTFIGSGLGVLGGLLTLVGSSALATFAPVAGGASIIWSILSLAASALCLFGAIQMWQLKKLGFKLYLVGSLIAIIITIVNTITLTSATGAMSSEMDKLSSEFSNQSEQAMNAASGIMSGAAWGSAIFGIIITIAFVLMYNANRKYLVK